MVLITILHTENVNNNFFNVLAKLFSSKFNLGLQRLLAKTKRTFKMIFWLPACVIPCWGWRVCLTSWFGMQWKWTGFKSDTCVSCQAVVVCAMPYSPYLLFHLWSQPLWKPSSWGFWKCSVSPGIGLAVNEVNRLAKGYKYHQKVL